MVDMTPRWRNPKRLLLKCMFEGKYLTQYIKRIFGGQVCSKRYHPQILEVWILLAHHFFYVHKFVKSFLECQTFVGRKKLPTLPLKPIQTYISFQQWGLDLIREIYPPSGGQHRWILVVIDYFTKWVESIPVKQTNDIVVIKFLEENILSRFGHR